MVIYQVLANDIRDHIVEYATLKAMGHTNGFLSRVVVTQAMIYVLAVTIRPPPPRVPAFTVPPSHWQTSRCG